MYQSVSINAHEIISWFNDGHKIDISKGFDRIWHEGLLFTLQQNRISRELITLMKGFLSCRKQRVVLNGQHLSWADIKADVPPGSILGPLLFLIYISDLPMAWTQMLNSLQMIRHCFLLFTILLTQPIYWIAIFLR